jgi:hypothetical protein
VKRWSGGGEGSKVLFDVGGDTGAALYDRCHNGRRYLSQQAAVCTGRCWEVI